MDDNKYIQSLKKVLYFKKNPDKVRVLTEASNLVELFVKQSEIEGMDSGLARDQAILRLAIIAELDAITLYSRLAELATNVNVKKVLFDVAKEEKTHAGEFRTLLTFLDLNQAKEDIEAKKEVSKLIK